MVADYCLVHNCFVAVVVAAAAVVAYIDLDTDDPDTVEALSENDSDYSFDPDTDDLVGDPGDDPVYYSYSPQPPGLAYVPHYYDYTSFLSHHRPSNTY